MQFTKIEMYDILCDYAGLDIETLDLILHVAGNTPTTYLKVLEYKTGYTNFPAFERACQSGVYEYDNGGIYEPDMDEDEEY